MKIRKYALMILTCLMVVIFSASTVQAKEITKGNINREISKQKKKVNKLQKKYKRTKAAAQRAKAKWKVSENGKKSILFGTVYNSNPLIVNSDYILSPTKGMFWVEGTTGGILKNWSGSFVSTGRYRDWNGRTCEVVKYSSAGLNKYRQYTKKLSVMKKTRKKLNDQRGYLGYLRGLKVSSLNLKNKSIIATQTKKFKFSWKNGNINDGQTKWKVNNSAIAQIVDYGNKYVTLKGKKAGTVTLTAKAAVSGKKSSCKIKVFPVIKEITIFSEDGSTLYGEDDTITLSVGKKFKLDTLCEPEKGKGTIQFKSKNEDIAKVSKKGVITGEGTGTTSIVVTASVGGKQTAKTSVKVSVGNFIKKLKISGESENTYHIGDTSGVTSMNKREDIPHTPEPQVTEKPYASTTPASISYDYPEGKTEIETMKKLETCSPQGMVYLEYDITLDSYDSQMTDTTLTCTSSDNNVVTPMYLYWHDVSPFDEYMRIKPIFSYGNNNRPAGTGAGGAVYIGLVGTGDATVTLTSASGASCSWNIHVVNDVAQKITPLKAKQQSTDQYRDEDKIYYVNKAIGGYYSHGIPLCLKFSLEFPIKDEILFDKLTFSVSDKEILEPIEYYYTSKSKKEYGNSPGGEYYLGVTGKTGDVTATVTSTSGVSYTWKMRVSEVASEPEKDSYYQVEILDDPVNTEPFKWWNVD